MNHLLLPVLLIHAGVVLASEKPLDVCEVLTNAREYNGKVIAVRGEWVNGPEQNYLKPFNCSAKSVSLSAVAGIDLTVEQGKDAATKVDWKGRERAVSFLKAHKRSGASGVVIVTATGRFEASTSLEGRGGYGHLGLLSAQLVYASLTDVAVEPKSVQLK